MSRNLLSNLLPQHLLERSVVSSGGLSWKHAPNITSAAVVATMMLTACRSDSLGDIVQNKMFARILIVITSIVAVLLLALVNTYSPTNGGPFGILAVFFLIYILCVGILTGLFYWGGAIVQILRRWLHLKGRRFSTPNIQKSYYFASIVGLMPVMLLAMGSVGSIDPYQVALVLLFVAIGVFYVEKRS